MRIHGKFLLPKLIDSISIILRILSYPFINLKSLLNLCITYYYQTTIGIVLMKKRKNNIEILLSIVPVVRRDLYRVFKLNRKLSSTYHIDNVNI